MAVDSSPILPGRLGTPDMALKDDPRADPRMIAAMEPFALGDLPAPLAIDAQTPFAVLLELIAATEEGMELMMGAFAADIAPVDGVTRRVEVIRGVDGNDITLFIHRPDGVDGPLPGILHLHGGGMVVLEAAGAGYGAWRDGLAQAGLVVVGVEFRNGGGKHGAYPFPAGLNDCSSALQWMHDNKTALGISKVVVSGESGGGNLTLATTLKAKRDGRIDQIDGVYAQCPYISNAYAQRAPELASLYENDGYFLSCDAMGLLSRVYDPDLENATNPLAWPYHASRDDLVGLPPHVISVNQLDPLRDEGLVYFRKLLDAGVPAFSRTVNGTAHAADIMFQTAMPEVCAATVRDIAGFAASL